MEFRDYANIYRKNLLEDVVPFWVSNSLDKEFGGYFSCLDVKGNVYATDKFIWLQCRQVWLFSMLYNKQEKKQEWLDIALHGADFLLKNGRDKQGNWYFSLNQEGQPLTQPYNIFSDCFAAMAFGQLFEVTKNNLYREVANQTFINILAKKENPKGKYEKGFPGTRALKDFALPMILCNLAKELEPILEPELVEDTIQKGIHEVMNVFYKEDLGVTLENVYLDATFSDSFEGRLISPGHGLEAMWFIMDLGERNGDAKLIRKAVDITLEIMEYGWDSKHGGLFYFLDVKGCPPQKLEWDQKLWWVHLEALISLLKGYVHTEDERCWEWFEILHTYVWDHFIDTENGEWFGYLNRQGEVLLDLKGGKWKGCFHVPRGLYQLWQTMEILVARASKIRKVN